MKIGFIGLGKMGFAMCSNILKKHDDTVYVYDVLEEPVHKMVELGAVACASNAEATDLCDVLISIVPKSQHVLSVYGDIAEHLRKGQVWVEMSTIEDSISAEIAEKVEKTGALMLDAPVVKSRQAAVEGKSGILCGGSEEAYQKVRPILEYMGEYITLAGGNGAGLRLKQCQNCMSHGIMEVVNEAITLAGIYGITVDQLFEACQNGGAANRLFENFYLKYRNDDYSVNFSVDMAIKDESLIENMAIRANFPLPAIQNILNSQRRASAMGYGSEDWTASIKAVRFGFMDKALNGE